MDETTERAVVVCANNAIFFGYTTDTTTDVVKLRSARNAHYYRCTKGRLELAASGPKSGSKIGDRADITVRGVIEVMECTPVAVEAWEAATWD